MISSRYQNNSLPTLDLNQAQIDLKLQVDQKVASGHYNFEEVSCAVCNHTNFHPLADKDRYGLYCSNVICKHCGLVMINPRMTEESYQEFYNQEYRTLYSGVPFNAANFFKRQNARGASLLKYLTSNGLVANDHEVPPLVLEVGCGAGGILNYFRSQGYQVKGIDIGEEYLKYGKEKHGLDLQVGSLAGIKLSRIPNIIIYSHVLEHVLNLNKELELLNSIADKDTLIYVEVPGIRNIASGYRNDPLRYFQNAHPFSFSLTSLSNLFAKHNFEILHGNEFVKELLKVGGSESIAIQNDFESTLDFLENAEVLRKFYFFSLDRIKVILAAFIDRIKTAVN
jgi:SAM-dependent methyltransferase